MKTFIPKSNIVERKWHFIDATNKTLGRLASEIATILMGKDKPIYTPQMETGDFVCVTNAEKIMISGNKKDQKIYYRHTGFIGGIKATPYKRMMEKKPEAILMMAVKGMLPKNRMASSLLKKVKIYAGDKHPHVAQSIKPKDKKK